MEQLNAVDLSRLDTLLNLRQEQERLQALKNKALEKADQVAPAVRARVLADYEKRFAGIEEQSAPLRAEARAEFRKIQALMDEVDRTRAGALERKQEAEFRHEVGEFDAGELERWLAEPNAVLTQCEAEGAALNDTAQRFVDALGTDIDGDDPPVAAAAPATVAPAAAVPQAAAIAAPATPMPTPGPFSGIDAGFDLPPADYVPQTMITPAPPLPVPEVAPVPSLPPLPPVPPVPPAGSGDNATVIGGIPIFDGGDDAFAELAGGPPDDPAEATFAFSREAVEDHLRSQTSQAIPIPRASTAVLILDDEGEVQEFTLQPGLNQIGRADQNEIQIVKPGISRQHATVELTAEGYILRDLKSNNGTYVNGDRITEHLLTDGDVVEVGPIRLVFHA